MATKQQRLFGDEEEAEDEETSGLYLKADAEISDCGTFRPTLIRVWDWLLPRVLFVMLNPSTADGRRDDRTVKRCVAFAKAWGFGSLEIVNLYSFRAKDPGVLKKAMRAGKDIGDRSGDDRHIVLAAERAQRLVCAWGAHVVGHRMTLRAKAVVALLRPRELFCMGWSAEGQPRHPLMLKGVTKPEPFVEDE